MDPETRIDMTVHRFFWASDWEPMVIGARGRYFYELEPWYSYVVFPFVPARAEIERLRAKLRAIEIALARDENVDAAMQIILES